MEIADTSVQKTYRRRTKSSVSRKKSISLSEADIGNEVAKHEFLKSSQVAEETSHSVVDPPWTKFKKGQRSKSRIPCKNFHKYTEFLRGECSIEPQKTRKIKRTANKLETEVTISLRSYTRGQARKRLSFHSRDISKPGKLNSKIFEFYLENLWREIPEEKKISFTYLDCLWFSLYSQKHYKDKVLNWIKKKNIFSKKYVFVPIVKWSHWSLLILCHFGESISSQTSMLLLDSLQTTNPKRLEPGIRRFILDLYKTEERLKRQEQLKKIPLLVPKVPQQRNDKECGYFVLFYFKLFVENAPESFGISKGIPYFMKEDFYQRLDTFQKTIDASEEDK